MRRILSIILCLLVVIGMKAQDVIANEPAQTTGTGGPSPGSGSSGVVPN